MIVFGVPAVVLLPLHATPDDQPPPFTAARLLTEWSSDWWVAVGIAAPMTLLGGYLGARVARRVDDRVLRWGVVTFGLVVSGVLAVT